MLPPPNTDKLSNLVNKHTISQCRLCGFGLIHSADEMVRHYVNKHPSAEVYISRLVDRFIEGRLDSIVIEKNTASQCPFCEKEMTLTEADWINHFCQHTGEYEYKFATNRPSYSKNSLNVFFCRSCYYAQLNKKRVAQHIMNEHKIDSEMVSTLFGEFEILRLRHQSIAGEIQPQRNAGTNSEGISEWLLISFSNW